ARGTGTGSPSGRESGSERVKRPTIKCFSDRSGSEKFVDRVRSCDDRPGCDCKQKTEKQCFNDEFKMILLSEKVLSELQESSLPRKFRGLTSHDCLLDFDGVHD